MVFIKKLGCLRDKYEWIGVMQLIALPRWTANGNEIEPKNIFDQFCINFYTMANLNQFLNALQLISRTKKNPGKHIIMLLNNSQDIAFKTVSAPKYGRKLFEDE
ncbi:hypothetical protein QTN25_001392 [Entamoeba marina]